MFSVADAQTLQCLTDVAELEAQKLIRALQLTRERNAHERRCGSGNYVSTNFKYRISRSRRPSLQKACVQAVLEKAQCASAAQLYAYHRRMFGERYEKIVSACDSLKTKVRHLASIR